MKGGLSSLGLGEEQHEPNQFLLKSISHPLFNDLLSKVFLGLNRMVTYTMRRVPRKGHPGLGGVFYSGVNHEFPVGFLMEVLIGPPETCPRGTQLHAALPVRNQTLGHTNCCFN